MYDAHTRSVLTVQRTDSALRLNVYFHVLALDSVYVRHQANGRLAFHALGAPTRADVASVASRTADRIEKILNAYVRLVHGQNDAAQPRA